MLTRHAYFSTAPPALPDDRRMVACGDALGHIGRSGITYGSHLHFEVRVPGEPVHPDPTFSIVRCTRRGAPE